MPIVAADATDRDAITALLDAVGLPHDDLTESALQHFRVLRTGGGLGGVVGIEPYGAAALLRSLAVQPARRGEGHGRALVRDVEAYARRQDVRTLYLLTTTAAGFFADLGYAPTDRDDVPAAIAQTAEFDRLCPDTAPCMQKSLIL
jgi:amino-acid N-acetyltransferase